MSKHATIITLTPEDRAQLNHWVRSPSTEQRLVTRAHIILAAAADRSTTVIATNLGLRTATVSKWRTRYANSGIPGLSDAPRSGATVTYGDDTERRILEQLDKMPPEGYSTWSGGLLAAALGNVPDHQVWRILRKHRIHLQRRRSWCVSTDPEFAPKAADIVGLYLQPPEGALVICVDEKPGIQALERAQGWLRLPNGKALTGYNHEYKRHGTINLFAALTVATGQVKTGCYPRKRRVEFLDFMNQVVAGYPKAQELHVVLDNYRTHKPKHDRWLQRHPYVHFHYTPTHASWLNLVEVWFSILWRQALRGASFTSPRQISEAIEKYVAAYSRQAHPFEWKKQQVVSGKLKLNYAHLRN